MHKILKQLFGALRARAQRDGRKALRRVITRIKGTRCAMRHAQEGTSIEASQLRNKLFLYPVDLLVSVGQSPRYSWLETHLHARLHTVVAQLL